MASYDLSDLGGVQAHDLSDLGGVPQEQPGLLKKALVALALPVQSIANELAPGSMDASPEALSRLARPALETAGAMGGAVVGGGAGAVAIPGAGALPGATVGGGLGFAGGKAAADLLDRALGVQKPIASMADAAKETGGDLQEGAAAEAGGKVLEGAAAAGGWLGKRGMTATLGPAVGDIEARLARNAEVQGAKPLGALANDLSGSATALAKKVEDLRSQALDQVPAVKNAQPLDVLARRLPQDVQQLASNLSDLSTAALQKLPDSADPAQGGLPTSVLTDSIQAAHGELEGSISKAAQQARQTLTGYLERAQALGPTVSPRDLGGLIRDMDNDIDWDAKEMMPQNTALEGIRSQVDGALKAVNPDYAQAMQPVADGTRLLKKTEQLFQVRKAPGVGYAPTNATAAALKGAVQDTRVDSQDVLSALKQVTGNDYLADVQNSLTKDMLLKGDVPPEVDAALRQANPKYGAAADLAQQRAQLLDKVTQIFNLKQAPGKGVQPGDQTIAALERAVGPDRPYSQDTLDALKALTGRDYQQEAQDAVTASKFIGGKRNGSARVASFGGLGAGLGSMLAGTPGAVAGAGAGGMAGLYLDTEGHSIAGSLVDQLVKLSQRTQGASEPLRRAIAAALAYGAEKRAPAAGAGRR